MTPWLFLFPTILSNSSLAIIKIVSTVLPKSDFSERLKLNLDHVSWKSIQYDAPFSDHHHCKSSGRIPEGSFNLKIFIENQYFGFKILNDNNIYIRILFFAILVQKIDNSKLKFCTVNVCRSFEQQALYCGISIVHSSIN